MKRTRRAENDLMPDLRYAVILEPDDGAFSVIVPSLPEIHTFGRTAEEALEMAREAIELSLEHRQSNGLDIPPSDADEVRLERVVVSLPAA